jgi:broad specificity phosphatase PhoE
MEKKYCGIRDISLSPQGRRQARRLRRRLKQENITQVYASDRKRALQTAKIVFKNVLIVPVADLREIHFGIFEGMTHDDILKKHGPLYRRWLKNPLTTPIPKGENMLHFKKRLWDALKAIARRHAGETIAIVCHGGVIGMVITHIRKTKDFWKYVPGSASLSILEYKRNTFRVVRFNDRRHL